MVFNAEDEKYIRENFNHIPARKICAILGKSTVRGVRSYATRLMKAGKEFAYPSRAQEPVEPLTIRDGYDTVPWHMRIDGRDQYVRQTDYNTTVLTED